MRRMAVAVIVATSTLLGCKDKPAPHVEQAPVPVIAAKAELRAVTSTLRAVGNVESIDTVAVFSRIDGPISRVLVRDGQEVERNQPIVQIDPSPLEIQLRAAEAALARDSAKLENAQVRRDHGAAILADHFISQDDFTQLKTDYESAQATVDADRADRDTAKLQLEYATIRAPVAGKLSHIAMQVGNMVHANSTTPLTTLNVLDPIEVSLSVPEQNVNALRAAFNAGPIPVLAEVTDDRKEIAGQLTFIDNAVDASTGTIRLRARFDNANRTLWPGQFVATRLTLTGLTLTGATSSTVVPNTAVQEGPSGPFVFVVDEASRAEQRSVQIINAGEAETAIAGVNVGEQVVTDGQSRLEPGSRVAVEQRQRLAHELTR